MRVSSWNARGFSACRRPPPIRKIEKLMEIAAKSHVIAVQEVHGTEGDSDVFLHIHRTIVNFFSPCAVRGAGGLLFVVGKGNF